MISDTHFVTHFGNLSASFPSSVEKTHDFSSVHIAGSQATESLLGFHQEPLFLWQHYSLSSRAQQALVDLAT